MPSVDINWWAVLVAVAVNMVVGAIWYSPMLFAKEWAKELGKKMNEMGDGAKSYVMTTIVAFAQALIFSYVIGWSGVSTAAKGAWLGLLVWIAFVFATQSVNTMFANSSKKLLGINTGYFLVVLVINGAILAVWR